jgi:capsular exopolysaccharide synthesis family protein
VSEKLPDISGENLENLTNQDQKRSLYQPYWRILRRKSWLVLGITGLTTIAAGIWSALAPLTYTGNFYLLVEPITSAGKLSNPTTIARTEGNPRDDLFSLDYPTNLVFLQSPGMTLKIAQTIYEEGKTTKTLAAIWKDLRENLSVERIRAANAITAGGNVVSSSINDTKIFGVSYSGKDDKEVQSVLETAANTFLKYSVEDRQTSIKSGVKFIEQQVPSLQARLNSMVSQQRKLREQHDLLDPINQGQLILVEADKIAQQQLDIQLQLNAKKSLYLLLNRQLELNPQEALAAAALSQEPTRLMLLNQLQEVENKLAEVLGTYTANSPQVQDLQEQRDNLRQLLQQKTQKILTQNTITVPQGSSPGSDVLNFQDPTRLQLIGQLIQTANEIKVLEKQEREIAGAKQKVEVKSKEYPAIITQYLELTRQIELDKKVLDNLILQRETLKVESAKDLPWQLISKPQIPLNAEGLPEGEAPSPAKKIAVGFFGGLLFGGILAILLEKRRNIFYETADIADTLLLPLVAEIPHAPHLNLASQIATETEGKDFTNSPFNFNEPGLADDTSFTDAFEALYNDLALLYNNPPLHSLVIAAADSGDGQSTVALNLAIAAANAGQHVLLVDVNWRTPQLHDWLNLSNHKGLTNLIADGIKYEEIIQEVPQIDRLEFLSAGNISPGFKLRLGAVPMQSLMAVLQKKYDLVIYDTPHLSDAPDLGLMASRTDGIVLVASIKHGSQSTAKQVVEKLKNLGVPILGVIANHPA